MTDNDNDEDAPATYLTQAEIDAIQHLHKKTPYLICDVSRGFFSVARYYGGAKFNGEHYMYNPLTDELVRDDVLKFVENLRKPKTKRKAGKK